MIIKKVLIKKKCVEVILNDNTSFNIGLETYLNNHILVGEEIDEKEIKRLTSKNEIDAIKIELINKLSRKRLSKKECINFLSSSNLKDEICYSIVKDLEKSGFINDVDLAESIVVNCLVNKKGRELIKETLYKRLVSGDYGAYIDEFLDIEKYKKNIIYLIEKYKKMGENKSSGVLRQYIKNKMVINGYNIEEFDRFVIIENRDETSIVKKEINRFFKSREVNEENISKIIKKLLSKGFNYGIIKNALEGVKNNETY